MLVKVQYLGVLRAKLGIKERTYEIGGDASLSDLLRKLAELHGEFLKKMFDSDEKNILDPSFVITINGILADRLHGLKTRLKDGDIVTIMSLISGG